MFMNKIYFAISFVLFFILTQNKILALELGLPNTAINPDKYLFYSVKRLIEKGIILTKFSKNSKVDYFRDLTLKRLAELKFLVEKDLKNEIERSSQRLSYQIGILSDYININEKELSEKKKVTSDLLVSFKGLLENLRDKYPANSSYWMLIQHNINSIDLNLEKLK